MRMAQLRNPIYAIAERLLVAILYGVGDALQVVLDGAGGDASAHKGGLSFYRYGGARRLLHVDLRQLGESTNYHQQSVALAPSKRLFGYLGRLRHARF